MRKDWEEVESRMRKKGDRERSETVGEERGQSEKRWREQNERREGDER